MQFALKKQFILAITLSAVGWFILYFQSARSSRCGSSFVLSDKGSKTLFSLDGSFSLFRKS